MEKTSPRCGIRSDKNHLVIGEGSIRHPLSFPTVFRARAGHIECAATQRLPREASSRARPLLRRGGSAVPLGGTGRTCGERTSEQRPAQATQPSDGERRLWLQGQQLWRFGGWHAWAAVRRSPLLRLRSPHLQSSRGASLRSHRRSPRSPRGRAGVHGSSERGACPRRQEDLPPAPALPSANKPGKAQRQKLARSAPPAPARGQQQV